MTPDSSETSLQLPPALQARLDAAGVSDDASLQAALEADPELRAEFEAFLQENPELLAAAQMNALLQAFAAVQDSEQMLEFWRQVPTEQEAPLMAAVETWIAQAQAAGDADAVNQLTPRLEGFRQVQAAAAQAQQTPPVVQALGAFFQAEDDAAATAVFEAQRVLLQPYEAQQMLDALAAQPPDDADAATRQRIVERRDLLRRLRGAAPAPLADAHGADDAPFAPRPSHLHGDLYQAERQYINSAHAESGGVATVVNHIFVQSVTQRWSRPTPPALRRDAVARPHEMAQVKAALAARGGVAITGETTAPAPAPALHHTPTLAMQGMAGVGKTVLAYLLAQELDAAYPDGVIWETLGPDFTDPAQTQAVLRRWVGYATNFFELDDNARKAFTFEAAAVRTLLAEHAHLLVVLDNVWSLDAIKPLQEALPRGAHLVITTRSAEIARGLGAGRVAIGRLSETEAMALVGLRLGWQPDRENAADAWVFALVEGVGAHALGLDVALGVLQREGGDDPGAWQAAASRLLAAMRRGELGDLTLGDDLDHDVQAVLYYSYRTLDALARERFRRLGAFALDANFTTAEAAAVWACAVEDARRTLVAFANAALVERDGDGGGRWRQHALLRGLALALLHRQGEQEAAAAAHARAYAAAMRTAEDVQRYHELLPAMPQLRHAMTWALANDLETALNIAAACLNLQIQFGLVRESAAWADQLIVAARQRTSDSRVAWRVYLHQGSVSRSVATLPGEDRRQRLVEALTAYDDSLNAASPLTSPERHANSQIGRGNILSELATLPGEDRRQRLDAALAAYDDALRFIRPDNAPLAYAQTQNNRANRLSELATLPGEDRRQRLDAALAAYDDALRFIRPDNAPLDYAQTQNNRANILSELATLPGEDRRQRLDAALAAYDDALRFIRPDNAPLDYATTQNNRALLLSALATLPGEDRRQRLDAALRCALEAVTLFAQFQQAQHREIGQRVARGIRAACGEDFAAIWAELGMGEPPAWLAEEAAPQSGGPALPAELQARLDAAGVHDEASLQAALAADPALRADFEAFLRENQAQFAAMQMSAFLQAFVAVQNSEQMAAFWRSVPAEQEEPFMAAVETWIAQAQTTGDSDAVAHLTPRLEGFRQVRAAAQATTDASGPTIPPELRAKLDAAGVSDDASLQAALEADPELRAEFEAFLQENPELVAAAQMNALLQAFTAVQDSEHMLEFWRRVPDEMEAPFMATVEQMIDRAQHAGDAAAVEHLQSRLDVFRQVRQAAAAGAMPDEERTALAAFVEKVRQYQEKLQSADAETPDAAVWQAITALGEELLAEEMHGWPGMDWAALRAQVASDYNTLGNALDSAGDKPAALAAFERAIALQPDFAMWRRNQAGTLIELGRLTDARAAIAAARALAPDAPRLADLEAELAAALGES